MTVTLYNEELLHYSSKSGLHTTFMGHRQTPEYHITRVLNKLQLFDQIQSKALDFNHFEKLDSWAALLDTVTHRGTCGSTCYKSDNCV